MRLRILTALLATMLVLVWVLYPPAVRRGDVSIRLTTVDQKAAGAPTVIATIFNAARYETTYDNGPILRVVCLRNGVWETNFTPGGVTGFKVLKGGTAEAVDISKQILPGATTVRVELSFMSLSWRGSLAFKMPQSRWLNPICSALFWADRRRRSASTWSEPLDLNRTLPQKIIK